MQNKCAWCGTSLELDVWLISIVCPYCKTISLVERWNLTSNWEKSFIMPFPTIFCIWKYFYAVESNNSNDKI